MYSCFAMNMIAAPLRLSVATMYNSNTLDLAENLRSHKNMVVFCFHLKWTCLTAGDGSILFTSQVDLPFTC